MDEYMAAGERPSSSLPRANQKVSLGMFESQFTDPQRGSGADGCHVLGSHFVQIFSY